MNFLDWARTLMPCGAKARLKRYLGIPQTRLSPDWALLAPIGPVPQSHVVFDVGAHHGWFFHCWKDWCPLAQVHAFEPTVESYRVLQAQYGGDPAVRLNRAGLGDTEGELELVVVQGLMEANSFLPPNAKTWSDNQLDTGTIARRAVPVTTVDAYCVKNALASIYLLKIDVQGFEMSVLHGAEVMLPRTDYVFVEAAMQPLFEGAPRFTGVADLLMDKGFHLIGLRAWHGGNRRWMETDMLFRRDELAPPTNPSAKVTINAI